MFNWTRRWLDDEDRPYPTASLAVAAGGDPVQLGFVGQSRGLASCWGDCTFVHVCLVGCNTVGTDFDVEQCDDIGPLYKRAEKWRSQILCDLRPCTDYTLFVSFLEYCWDCCNELCVLLAGNKQPVRAKSHQNESTFRSYSIVAFSYQSLEYLT